jgi:hypothetical protein
MLEHYYHNDEFFGENWFSYPNFYRSIVEQLEDGDVVVEVGAWKGRSTSFLAVEIANSKKNILFYVVDTWEGSIEHKNGHIDYKLNSLYQTFLKNMAPVEEYYFPLKISSLEASKKFKNNSLKFVFLDASHEYEDVKNDIQSWLPKIKTNGILAGHDYYTAGEDWYPGVKQAVNEELTNIEITENCWAYKKTTNSFSIKEKLKDFPSVNFISIEESEDRRKCLIENFTKFGVKNITPHIYKKYSDSEHKVICGPLELLPWGRGPVTSHLKAIKEWYEHTEEQYTFFCEDDLSFDSVKYWNFTWKDFFNKLPVNWKCVQLCLVSDDVFSYYSNDIKLRYRCFNDWSGCAYLITREHAKNLIDNYYNNETFYLEYKGCDAEYRSAQQNAYWFLLPHIENLIFSQFYCEQGYSIYTFPLFLESVNLFDSTWTPKDTNFLNKQSYKDILEWWQTKGRELSLDKLMLL